MKLTERPIIVTEKNAIHEVEKFQNEILRPILKMQNELLIAFFKENIAEKNLSFSKLEVTKQRELLKSMLQKDFHFRSLMIGLVCGHFSEDEVCFYFQHKTEMNKRIVSMLEERLFSQKEKWV